MKFYIGCDLGGTNIKVGLVNVENGNVISSKSTPTLGHAGHDAVMQRMADIIEDLILETQVDRIEIGGVGVSAPGAIDLDKGETLFLPNLYGQWRNVPLRDRLKSFLNLPVTVLNDGRAITYGEWSFGAGRGVDSMACFAIGTGVGGGLVVNRQLVLGIGGMAGELGHQIVDMHGPKCGCGNYGCLEVFTSGPAIATMAVRAVNQGWTTKIAELCEHDLNKITPELVAKAALAGDEVAQEIWDTAGQYLGIGVCNVVVAIAPRRVVISGGVSAAGDLLLNPIRRTLKERIFILPVDQVEVVKGTLGNAAGIVGAAVWASQVESFKG